MQYIRVGLYPTAFLKGVFKKYQFDHSSFLCLYCLQQRDQIFEVPKTAVQHLSTCLELFSGISRYRIWLMTLPEMGVG